MNHRFYYREKSDKEVHRQVLLLVICIVLGVRQSGTTGLLVEARMYPTSWHRNSTPFYNSRKSLIILPLVNLSRGGATSSKPTISEKKRKRKKTKTASNPDSALSSKETQEIVSQKLKEKDAAQALGDAIRERSHDLRFGSNDNHFSPMRSSTKTMESVSYALGASDYMMAASNVKGDMDESDASIAEELIDPTAVIVQYFLKSHGGAHALQCMCSFFATIAGIAGCLVGGNKSATDSILQLTFIKRCMMFAVLKHASGLFAAAAAAAMTIPTSGFQQAVLWMQTMAKDPVSQYVFYAAAVFLWLPSTSPLQFFKRQSVAELAIHHPIWWQGFIFIPFVLVGPVVIREFISIALVVTDVFVLLIAATSSTRSDESKDRKVAFKRIFMFAQVIVDSIMSIIVTPETWRSSTALQRQAILAKLTSKVSLALEVAVGILMTSDALIKTVSLLFLSTGTDSIPQVLKSCVLARLYLQFLWTRRKKIAKLAASVRGGALVAPLYFLDVLLDPSSSMGLSKKPSEIGPNHGDDGESNAYTHGSWRDYLQIALDIAE